MDYGNILSGGAQAIVEVISSAGNISRMSLDDAVSRGYLGIEGANVFEGRGKEILTEMVQEARLRGEDAGEIEMMLKQWDKLPGTEKVEIESQMAMAFGLSGEGNHTALTFVNRTTMNWR